MFLISLCCASSASTSCRCPTTRSPATATSTCPASRYESSCAGESSAIANSLRSSPRGPAWSCDAHPGGIAPGEPAACGPLRPGQDPGVGTRRLVEHRQVLEEVPVRIAKVHGGGRHPADDARLGRLGREERERRDAEGSEAVARAQHIVERRPEGDVQRQPDGRRSERPEAEHRLARLADPEERGATFRGLQRERQTDDVPVERHRPTQVAHREVRLEETADRNGRRRAHRPHARRYGSFAARTSTCSISGGSARSSSALPSRAVATAPAR